MRISHRHKFIFFASPKTGSESVRAFLDPLSDVRGAAYPTTTQPLYEHMRPAEARRAFRQFDWDFESYYRFVLVRNPWRRLASLYAMIRGGSPDFVEPFLVWLAKSRVDGYGGGGKVRDKFRQYGTYKLSAFAGDGEGKLLVNDVFRLEDIATLPSELRRRGLPIPLGATVPHLNFTSGAIDYRQIYTTDESIELVRTRYADEIASFGYEFPSGQHQPPPLAIFRRLRSRR